MLGSDYRELIVPKTDNGTQKAGILIGGAVLTLAAVIFSLTVGKIWMLLIATVLGFGTWFLWTNNCIEYEYIISGDELEITKILGQSRRKAMLTVSLGRFTAFGRLADLTEEGGSETLVLACSQQDDTAYYADFDHADYGRTRLVFTPNDDILEYLSKHMPRSLGFRYTPQ